MARPLRIEYENACYHVMNRGDNRRTVFSSGLDNGYFISKLSEYAEIYNVEVYAYCLMGNHFHLYLCTPNANLSRFMRSLLTAYSVYRNHTGGTCGHVFQGRYKAIVVDKRGYSAELSRYIHLNPVRTKQYEELALEKKRKVLRNFTWSSYPAVIGLVKCPSWLKRNSCYRIPGILQKKQKDYAKYVEYGLLRDINNPMELVTAQSILGSESFIDKIRRQYIGVKQTRSCPDGRKVFSFMSLDDLIKEVATYYVVSKKKLFAKFDKNNEPRQMLMLLSRRYCRGRYPLVEIAREFGLTVDSFSANTYKFKKNIVANKTLEKNEKALRNRLENVK